MKNETLVPLLFQKAAKVRFADYLILFSLFWAIQLQLPSFEVKTEMTALAHTGLYNFYFAVCQHSPTFTLQKRRHRYLANILPIIFTCPFFCEKKNKTPCLEKQTGLDINFSWNKLFTLTATLAEGILPPGG